MREILLSSHSIKTDRQTVKQMGGLVTVRQLNEWIDKFTSGSMDTGQTEAREQIVKQTDRQTDKRTDIQTFGWTDRPGKTN
jgi:hypothetical protein